MAEHEQQPTDDIFPQEEPSQCSVCGEDYEIVRPGKEQPVCQCHMRCPCGRMKRWFNVEEHPTDPKHGGYLCPNCGILGPSETVEEKSIVGKPAEENGGGPVLLTMVRLGRVGLPIPFGHGFFFNTETAELVYSPYPMHIVDRKSWSMDSDFPLTVPEEVEVSSDPGLWVLISSVCVSALNESCEADQWRVLHQVAEEMVRVDLERRESVKLHAVQLVGFQSWADKSGLKTEIKKLNPELSYEEIIKKMDAQGEKGWEPWTICKLILPNALLIQEEFSKMGASMIVR